MNFGIELSQKSVEDEKVYYFSFCSKISSFESTVLVSISSFCSSDSTRPRTETANSFDGCSFSFSLELLEIVELVDENFGLSLSQRTIFDFRIRNEFELMM